MTKEKLEQLKADLNRIKVKKQEKKRAKRIKERESIEAEIQHFTNKMIAEYELMKYDSGIKMESYKTDFFIFDVEDIIRDLVAEKEE